MKKNVEEILQEYKKETKNFSSKNKDERILALIELQESKKMSNTFLEFAKGQFGIFGKYSLIWELVWLAAFMIFIFKFGYSFENNIVLVAISLFTPFLIIIFAIDAGRITNRSMLEIEATTRYSIPQIILFRGLTFEILQMLMVFIAALICHSKLGASLFYLLIYGYTPLIFSSVLLLACISKFMGRAIEYVGVSITVLMVTVLGTSGLLGKAPSIRINIYDAKYIWAWEIVLAISIIIYFTELLVIRKGVKVNGIGAMRSIETL